MPSGTCGKNLQWILDDNGIFTISGKGKMKDYSDPLVRMIFFWESIPWSSYLNFIKQIVICDGITSIGSYAFRFCKNLKIINITNDVMMIGECAFLDCTNLTDVVIPAGVNRIDRCAFSGCEGLTVVKFPSTVTYIGNNAFSGCTELTSVTLPEGISVDMRAFSCCTNLTSIIIPKDAKIGWGVFSGCKNLKEIHYHASLFYKSGFDRRILEGNNAKLIPYTETPSVIRSKLIVKTTPQTMLKSIPQPVKKSTASSAQVNSLPQPVTENEKLHWKFEDKTLTIDGVHGTEDYSSKEPPWKDYLESIEKIIIANGVEKVSAHLFFGCSNVSEIVFPASIKSIGDGAFCGCTSLTSIRIPYSVTKIGFEVFSGCENLEKIYYPVTSDFEYKLCTGNNAQIIAYTVDSQLVEKFWWKVEGKILTVGGIHEIGDYSSKGFPWKDYLDLVEKIVIINGVKKIIAHAFADFPNIEEVVIPASITDIGDFAFVNSFCGNEAVNDGKNVIWCLEDGILVIKKNPTVKDIDADFSMSDVPWKVADKNIRGFKFESGVVPNKTFFDWFIQRDKMIELSAD